MLKILSERKVSVLTTNGQLKILSRLRVGRSDMENGYEKNYVLDTEEETHEDA